MVSTVAPRGACAVSVATSSSLGSCPCSNDCKTTRAGLTEGTLRRGACGEEVRAGKGACQPF